MLEPHFRNLAKEYTAIADLLGRLTDQQQLSPLTSASVAIATTAPLPSSSSVVNTSKSSGSSKTSRKIPRDPNAPKRPLPPYLKFCGDERATVKGQYPKATSQQISIYLGERWQNLPPERKQYYQNIHAKENAVFVAAMAAYKAATEAAGRQSPTSPPVTSRTSTPRLIPVTKFSPKGSGESGSDLFDVRKSRPSDLHLTDHSVSYFADGDTRQSTPRLSMGTRSPAYDREGGDGSPLQRSSSEASVSLSTPSPTHGRHGGSRKMWGSSSTRTFFARPPISSSPKGNGYDLNFDLKSPKKRKKQY
ncbi:non-histone protein [Dispira simplex]|nr:non-histone protein [Dispira simplex]